MKKIPVSPETIQNIVDDYNNTHMGSPTLSKKYGLPKSRVLKILKENGCQVGPSGRKYMGGKSESDKRYYKKNKKIRRKRPKTIGKIGNIAHQYKIREESEKIEKETLPFNVNDVLLKNAKFKVIDRKTTKPIIEKYEWLGYLPKYCNHYFGLYFTINGKEYLGGVVALQPEYGENMGVWDKYGYTGKIIQLSRGVCLWWTPKNSASFMISKVCDWLKKNTHYKVITATTDPHAGEIGTIYQALNWNYVGVFGGNLTKSGKERIRYGYIIDGKIYNQRHIRSKIGTAKKEVVLEYYPDVKIIDLGRKRRYFHFLGDKRENKQLIKPIQDMIRPYPKR